MASLPVKPLDDLVTDSSPTVLQQTLTSPQNPFGIGKGEVMSSFDDGPVGSDAQVPSLWSNAISHIEDEMPDALRCSTNHIDIRALIALLKERVKQCQAKKLKRKQSNGTEVYVVDDVYKMVVTVKGLTSIVNTLASYDPAHIAIPWACFQAILKAAENVSYAFASLTEGLELVTSLAARYALVESQHVHAPFNFSNDITVTLRNLYVAILRYLICAYRYLERGRMSRAAISVFPTPSRSPTELLKDIHVKDGMVQKALIALNVTVSTDTREMVKTMVSPPDILSKDKTSTIAKDEQTRQLIAWLKPIDSIDTFENAIQACLAGTSSWIMSREAYYHWSNESVQQPQKPRVLWIQGPPGFGKTVICAQIIKALRSSRASGIKPMGFFFCTSERKERQEPIAVLRSWISQLILANDQILTLVYSYYVSTSMLTANESELWAVLGFIVQNHSCTLVVDGLDECIGISSRHSDHDDGRSQFLDSLMACLRHENVSIIISSRGYDFIRSILYLRKDSSEIALYEQAITHADNQVDILAYSKALMNKKLPQATDNAKDDLAKDTADKSEGMFLYVNLLSRGLRTGDTVHTIRKAISAMPQGLNTVFQEELHRIMSGSSKKQSLDIFRWILFADRPLTLREMAEALIITSDSDTREYPYEALPLTWDKSFVDQNWIDATITRHCGTFVELRKANDLTTLDKQTVHFPHASMREFLLEALQTNQDADGGLKDTESETNNLVSLCLKYLCYDIFQKEDIRFKPPSFLRKHPFIFYASTSWQNQVKNLKVIPKGLLEGLERLLDPATKNWMLWSEIFERKMNPDDVDDYSDNETDPHSALDDHIHERRPDLDEWDDAGFSDSDTSQQHIAKDDIESQPEAIDTPSSSTSDLNKPQTIYYAALLGLTDLVISFLARGMSCDTIGGQFGTPLQAAVSGDHDDIVDILFSNGVNVNTVAGYYGTALAAACAQGKLGLVQRLLDGGADPALQCSDGLNALHYACFRGNFEIVQLLLKQNSDLVRVKNLHGSAPIVHAMSSGNIEIIRALLRAGANIDSTSQYGSPLLHMAIDYGHQDLAKYLIKHRADVQARGEKNRTALLCAAEMADYNNFRLLLAHGADEKVLDSSNMSLMHYAVRGGSIEIVKIAINRGADVQASAGNTVWPIHIAAALGTPEMLQFLFDNGADLNIQTKDLLTPLMQAISYGNLKNAKWLLANKVDVSMVGLFGDTLLDYALDRNCQDLLEDLLVQGAMRDMENLEDSQLCDITALKVWQCISTGAEDALLEEIDEKIREDLCSQADKDSGLLMALTLGSAVLAKGLLERGADVNCKSKLGRTPLHVAVRRRFISFVDLLIDRGAKLDAKDNRGCTPLRAAITQGIPAAGMITEHLLKHEGILDLEDIACGSLQPGEETVKDLRGEYKGNFTFDQWNMDTIGNVSVKMHFSRTPEICHGLPWFVHESVEVGVGDVMTIGIAYGDDKCIFLRLNKGSSWYCQGQLVHDEDENGHFLAMRGRWGEHDQAWYGSMNLRKIGDVRH